MCVHGLPSGSRKRLFGMRREVVGGVLVGWVVVDWVGGVVGAMVVTDTFSTDRQGMEWHRHTQTLLSTACRDTKKHRHTVGFTLGFTQHIIHGRRFAECKY